MSWSRRAFLQLAGAAALAPAGKGLLPYEGENNAALCRKLASDPLRPQYHLMPAHNWMNDPNGPIFFAGRYHMFHQYNPEGAVWGNMHWAHAVSPDMVHWQHEPIALSPTPGGPDSNGVFSGTAVLDHGKPTVIYTGVAPPASAMEATLRDGTHTWHEAQCLAVAQDDALRVWKKITEPVIAAPPAGLTVTGFRDPALWRESDEWMLVLGSGMAHKGGAILLYSSPDLRRWTYLHPLIEGTPANIQGVNPVDTGDMWECPDFFPLGDKHVLLISTMGKVRWKVGTYENRRFHPEKEGVVDWGSYYAAKTMVDTDGTRVLWGWITEARADEELLAAGWAGAMSLPRALSLSSDGELETDVAPAAQKLRGRHTSVTGKTPPTEQQKALDNLRIHDLAAELLLDLHSRAAQFSILLEGEDGEDFAEISFTNKLGVRELRVGKTIAPLRGPAGSPLHLHMFLDGSVLEIFANHTTAVTARAYRIPAGPLRLKIAGETELVSLDMWQMNPISKDRLTASLCS